MVNDDPCLFSNYTIRDGSVNMKVLSRKEKPKFNSKPEPGSEDPKSKNHFK